MTPGSGARSYCCLHALAHGAGWQPEAARQWGTTGEKFWQNFSDRFLILRSSAAPFSCSTRWLRRTLMGGDGGQARDVGQRPTVDQVKTRTFTRQHVVDALVQYFTNSQGRIRRPVLRRIRDGGPEIRALIAAAVPWLARAMAC
jgi:hypothetical protein